jgi:gliding motility-associated-like protein
VSLTGNTGSTIRWQSSTDGTTYNNFAPSQTGTTINSVVNNAAPGISQVVTYYKAIVQNGVCPNQTTNAITVSVDPSSKVGSISLAQKIQQWCIGSPATAVTLPTYTGTIIWKTATTLGGTYNTISGQTAATLPSANLPTNVAGTLYYRAVVTSGVCPSINSDIISVQTDAATVAGTIASSSNLICNGVTPPTITLTGNTGSTIQWRTRRATAVYVNTIPAETGTSIKSVVNNAAPGAIQIVDYYQAIVKSGVCNSLTTNEVVVAIDPTSQVGLLDPLQKTQQVCIGSPATSVVLPSNVGTIQWQTATVGGVYGNMTGLTSATLPNASMPTSAAGTLNYRAVVTSGVCPSINSEVASVQVDPATVAGTIASSSNLICNGVTPPTITLTGNTGSTIQWRTRRATAVYVNPIPSQTGTSINSVVNNAAPGAVQIVDYYQAIVKSGVCNSLTTNEVVVAIDPTSQVGLLDPLQKTQQVCIASPAKSVVLPTYVGTIQWQTATVGGAYGNMTGLTNATLPFGSIPTNVAGILNYRAVVTSGVCPSINSEIVSVQVDAATVAGDIYYLKGSTPICNQGEKPTITIRNNTGSNIVWQITTISNSSSVIGTANSLAYSNTTQTGNILNSAIDNNAPGAVSSFKYYRASVQNGVCKTEYTTALELEVIPTPVITKVVPAERCGPGIVELLAESNLGTPNWFAANTGGTAIGIGNSFTTPVLNTSTNYYVGAIFRGCVSFSRTTVLAKIKPIPTITSVTGATNCGPGILELSATATGGEINWFTDPTGGSTLLTSPKYTTPLIRVTTTYYAQALQDGCYSAPRAPVEATIFEVPVIAALPDLYSICAGLTYNIKYSASLGLPPYVFNFFTNNSNVIGQKDGYLTGVKGGITNVYFNVKDMNGCVSLNTNSFQVKTYDPLSPQRFNYQAFYKDNFLIPTKIDSGYVSYNWQPGLYLNNPDKPNPIFNGENTTDYVLIRTDTTTKCTVADNYHIDVTKDFIFDLPNAFTPNYDGLNDVIKSIKNAGIDKVTSLSIFNRYGTKVCCTVSEIENGWNGTTNGKMQDTDGYFWRATFETKDGKTLTKKGAFLLLK